MKPFRLFTAFDLSSAIQHFADPEGNRIIEMQVTPVGTFFHPTLGKIEITNEMNQAAADYFDRSPAREIGTDFNHGSSVQGATRKQGEASGWIKRLVNKVGRGLFATWRATKTAAGDIANEKYKYFSPSLDFNIRNKFTGKPLLMRIASGGLTNRPFFEGMQPLSFSDIPADGLMQFCAADDLKDFDDTINSKPKGYDMKDLITRLKASGMLGKDFSDEATEAEVTDALEAKATEDKKKLDEAEAAKVAAEKKTEVVTDPKSNDPETAKLQDRLDASEVQNDKTAKDFSDYKEKTEAKERKIILADAVKNGKISAEPATVDYWDGRLKSDFDDTAKHITETMRKNQYTKTDGTIGSNDAENMPASFMDACDLQRGEFKKAGNKDFSEDDVISAVNEKFPNMYENEFTDQA